MRKAHQDQPSPIASPKTTAATGALRQGAVCRGAARAGPAAEHARELKRSSGQRPCAGDREGGTGEQPFACIRKPHTRQGRSSHMRKPHHPACLTPAGSSPGSSRSRALNRDRRERHGRQGKPPSDREQKGAVAAAESSPGPTGAYLSHGAGPEEESLPRPGQCSGKPRPEHPHTALNPPRHQGKRPERHPRPPTLTTTPPSTEHPGPPRQTPTDDRPAPATQRHPERA